jgi:hypothetical protein
MSAIPFAHGVGDTDPMKWNIAQADNSAQNLDNRLGFRFTVHLSKSVLRGLGLSIYSTSDAIYLLFLQYFERSGLLPIP